MPEVPAVQANDTSGQETGEPSKTELRAQWEGFEFRVPAPGRVRVENVSYGEDSDDHVYVVEVAEYVGATSCTCPSDEYREGECKHQVAVENQEAVIEAATEGMTGAYSSDGSRVAADGGKERDESDGSDDEGSESEDDERPTQWEYADFGGGESSGVDEL